jgi:alkanesulfonate monooxygenase SsuD/methylene tetrahydromethanopterin reductase-like flavin-dependent oxidoreductase (luciferase family)
VEEAIQVMRLLWSGQHGTRFDGKFYRLAGANSGPAPKHPIGIWLGAYKPRMLSIVGRLADGWVPSYGYVKEAGLLEGNRRIDEAATAAGRDPRSIRRVLNTGQLDAATLVALVVDHGMDTFLVTDDPDVMKSFMSEVAPRVREEVESRRSRSAN